MDAHRVILTTLAKRQLLELKKRYRKESQRAYGTNHSPDPQESFANVILYLAKLAFLGFAFLCMILAVMVCGAFIGNGFTGGVATLVISISLLLITIIVKKIKLKLSFTTVISLLIIYWKARIYKISMPEID